MACGWGEKITKTPRTPRIEEMGEPVVSRAEEIVLIVDVKSFHMTKALRTGDGAGQRASQAH